MTSTDVLNYTISFCILVITICAVYKVLKTNKPRTPPKQPRTIEVGTELHQRLAELQNFGSQPIYRQPNLSRFGSPGPVEHSPVKIIKKTR